MVSFMFIVAVKLCFQFACYIYILKFCSWKPPPMGIIGQTRLTHVDYIYSGTPTFKTWFHESPGARVLLQILSSRGQVIFLARLPGSPPIWYEVKVDYLFILKGHFYTWVCVYMCVVRQRNRFKSVPTHPEIKLSIFVFNIFFGMCRYIFEPISLSYDHTSSSDVIGHWAGHISWNMYGDQLSWVDTCIP